MSDLASVLRDGARRLAEAGVPTPEVDMDLLAAHVLGISRGELAGRKITGTGLSGDQSSALDALIARRAAREPLQHITGIAHFRHLTLEVGPGVFVPRPETEMVAQLAIDALAAVPGNPIAIDLGTGSGAIAIALATEVPHAEVHAVEVSAEAFVWAKLNAKRAGASNLTLHFGDLADAPDSLDGRVDVVVSNPPYIPEGMIPRDVEVRLHDPALALYGGPDGLDVVRTLERSARRLLREGGFLVIEHAEIQGEQIRELLTAAGWRAPRTHPDLTGRPRATTATLGVVSDTRL